MACRLTVEVSGQAVSSGMATRLTVFGTASAGCPAVRVTASMSLTSPPVFQGVVTVVYPPQSTTNPDDAANDGRFVAEFAAPGGGTACGMPVFVSVECVADPSCRLFGWRSVDCKVGSPGGGGNGDPGDDDDNDGNSGDEDWDWPFLDPPSIVCPIWGRVFVNMLWPAMAAIVTGLSFLFWPAVAGGLLLFAGAMAWYGFWSRWCAPPTCGVYRAWTWVLKRCTALAFTLAVAQQMIVPNLWAWLLVPALGVPVGWLVTGLRRRRCSIPASTDTVQQLQLW
jgi:hypothetical protein